MKGMVSMKRSPKERDGDPDHCCTPEDMESPDYPWGLRLHLSDEQLAALGIDQLPSVNTPMQLQAVALVIGVNEETVDGGEPKRRLELQITDLGMSAPKKPIEDRMYAKK